MNCDYSTRSDGIITIFLIRNVRQSKDFGKSIRWPAPPKVLADWVTTLKRVHARLVQHVYEYNSTPLERPPIILLQNGRKTGVAAQKGYSI